jgi:preprotein translocase subunit SecG
MYNIFIFLLSFGLVLTCLFLILLVLVQLPKKEAGLGQAFGSGTTDALFGPGSGNMLTKLTKWSAGIFFVLTIFIWLLQGHNARAKVNDPRKALTAAEKAALDPKNTNPPAQPPGMINTNLLMGTNAANTNPAPTNASAAKAPTNPPATKK